MLYREYLGVVKGLPEGGYTKDYMGKIWDF